MGGEGGWECSGHACVTRLWESYMVWCINHAMLQRVGGCMELGRMDKKVEMTLRERERGGVYGDGVCMCVCMYVCMYR